jgi:hypothetical protein
MNLNAEYRQLAAEQEQACMAEQRALARLEELDRRRCQGDPRATEDALLLATNAWRLAKWELGRVARAMRDNRSAAMQRMSVVSR